MLKNQLHFSYLIDSKQKFEPGKTSTPIRFNKMENFQSGNKDISPVVAVEKKDKLIVLITKAIKAVGHPRKGASFQAIKNWIIDLNGNETNRFKTMLKLALLKGISTGVITRPTHCLTAVGATGSFKLSKQVSKEAPKKTVKNLQMTSTPKVKKETKGKKTIEKKISKVAGKKVPTKPSRALPSKKQNNVFSSSDSEGDNKNSQDKIKSKPRTKIAAKQPKKQKSKKENLVSKMDPSKTKPARVKKEALVENIPNSEKEKSTETTEKGENAEEIATKKKQTKKKLVESEKADKHKKENVKTVTEKTAKVPRNKKIFATKDVPLRRKECSDTELEVNNRSLMPLKSHSSDTELELSKRENLNNKKNMKSKERKMQAKKIGNAADIE